jgi:hypothetical protein
MTARRRWLPDARAERVALVTKTTAFMAVEDNRTRTGFGRSDPQGIWYDSVYVPKLTVYDAAYRRWANPATATRMALDDFKDSERAFVPLYRRLYGMMKASALVSNSDLEEMGFQPRNSGKRSPHPVDRMFISLRVAPLGSHVLNVAFENRDTGSSVIPYYLVGAVIFGAVSDTPVASQERLVRMKLATRSPGMLVFNSSQRGRTLYLAARWQNRRGELGPWSEIMSAIIP